jgi:hypothetical protein
MPAETHKNLFQLPLVRLFFSLALRLLGYDERAPNKSR